MAVTTEPPWINHTTGVSARNGTTTHTISLGFTPTSGNFLQFVVYGSVTHTNAGWTERAQPVSNGELSVFTKTSDGTETTFVDTANSADKPVVWAAYEFAAGTTWTGVASANQQITFATLSGLPGTEQVVFAAMGVSSNSGNSSNISTATWTAPWVEDTEVSAAFATTDGGSLMVGHQINVTATSITPTATFSHTGSPVGSDEQTVTWALNAVAPGPTVSAGADATATVGVLFSRTATESGLTSVTARNWEIISGPGGAVSSIGTAAALSWTPGATGSYVLRYSATHSAGTSTDDATITVVNPRPTPVSDRGSTQNITAGTTTAVTLTSPTAVATGNYLVARVAVDNSGTNGAAPGCTVTDPRSNTWTVLGPALVDPGAAAAGAAAYIAYAKVVTPYQAADALTFNWGGVSTTAKAVVVEEWQYIHATSPVAVAAVTNNAAASTAMTIGITPTAADQTVYTCLATEGPTGDTAPTDADTTNGSWVALTRLSTGSGTAASNQTVAGGYKQVSASGAQTWNATITARDWAAVAVVFAPTELAATGAAAGTTPALTGALTGTVTQTGVLAGTTVPVVGAIASGTPGELAATTVALTGALTGTVTQTGALAATTVPVVGALATTTPTPPTVAAGRARPAAWSSGVGLDVTATPPGGQTITAHSWTIQSGGGSLTNETTATPTYTAPSSGTGTAVIRDTVTASGGGTATADVTVGYGANIVAAENTLTGTARATWDLPTTDLGGLPTLQGFADGFTVNRDTTVNFKIAQSDGAGWAANVYRLGYYGGNGARDYGPVTPTGTQVTNSQAQPTSLDADPNTTLKSADCSNWSTTLTWTPPAWAPSGIYVLKLNRTGGGTSHVLFVLRDDARTADLMFMPADSTWQAYNAFRDIGTTNWSAGNSLYFGLAINQYDADCARYVSYNRPVINRAAVHGGYGAVQYSNFFTGEYGMLRFVERNGVDTKYYGCIDAAGDAAGTHLTGNGSTRGSVTAALFVGHNEYWSNSMRAGWEAAKTAGVSMFACAGNEVFWRTVGADNDSEGRPRTIECFKSTISSRGSTGRTEWTGTWRDPDGAGKGGNSPENVFTGTAFAVNGPDLRALQVPFAGGYSAQPLWRHTSVAALTTGQTYTSPDDIVGFEWDTYGPAGIGTTGSAYLAAPHSQVKYCSTVTYSLTGVVLTDAGDIYGSGNVTHRLVVQPSGVNGGITFGTGTVNWAWGVDAANAYQVGADRTDTVLQQATINILTDMGAPAATLMGGLTEPTAMEWFTVGTAAATTPPLSGALTGGVTDTAVLAGTTVPLVGALASAATTTGEVAASTPLLAGALAAAVVADGAAAATTVPVVGALAGDVVDVGVSAGTTVPPVGALAGGVTDAAVLAAATAAAAGAVAATVSDVGVLAGATPPLSASLTSSNETTGALAATTVPVVGALAGDVVDVGVSAGTTVPAAAALAAAVTDAGVLAGTTVPASAAVAGGVTTPAALAGTTVPLVAALAGTVTQTGVLAATTAPLVGTLFGTEPITGALAATTVPLVGSLFATEPITGPLAGVTVPPVGALGGDVVDPAVLAAATPTLFAAFTTPLLIGTMRPVTRPVPQARPVTRPAARMRATA